MPSPSIEQQVQDDQNDGRNAKQPAQEVFAHVILQKLSEMSFLSKGRALSSIHGHVDCRILPMMNQITQA